MATDISIFKNLLNEIIQTVEVIGIEKMIVILQNEREQSDLMKNNNPIFVYILRLISEHSHISIDKFINGDFGSSAKMKTKSKMFFSFIVFYLNRECDISLANIGKIFGNKSKQVLSNYKKKIDALNASDNYWHEQKIYLDSCIEKFKLSN